MEVALPTVKAAEVPLNFTAVAPVKFVPVRVTLAPTAPEGGLKPVRVGAGATVTVKLVPEVAVPPGVVTERVPEVAPVGTVAVMEVALPTVKAAEVPLNFTAVAPVKFVPVRVTLAPTAPEVGLKPVRVGAVAVTMKVVVEVAVPPEVVTERVPEVAPVGTVAVMEVALPTVKAAEVPLNFTAVAPVKFVPVRVTLAPTAPEGGLKPVRVGAEAVTMKVAVEVAVPFRVVTEMAPLLAPVGTVVVMEEELTTVKVAEIPLNFTAVAPVNLAPVRVTLVPAPPEVGVKLVIAGGGAAWRIC
jgi:hypothetical protein